MRKWVECLLVLQFFFFPGSEKFRKWNGVSIRDRSSLFDFVLSEVSDDIACFLKHGREQQC